MAIPMPLQPNELEQQGYTRLESLNHQELIPFVRRYLGKRTLPTVFYFVFNVVVFTGLLWMLFDRNAGDAGLGTCILFICYGFCISFLLIPLHEGIHVLAYRMCGAKQTSLAANWSKFYFMALAHQFVADARAFRFIALAPFVVISNLLLVPVVFGGLLTGLMFAGALFAHGSMCAGDFGLLGYFAAQKDHEILTYDDVENGISYFYGRKRSQGVA